MTIRRALIPLLALALVSAACGDDGGSTAPTTASGGEIPAPGEATGTLVVTAPTALEAVVTALGEGFEDANPDANTDVATADREQIAAAITTEEPIGAVVVPDAWLDDVSASLGDAETVSFGRNVFVVVTPPDNPGGVSDLSAFAADAGLRTRVCSQEIELGNLATIVLDRAGVAFAPDSVGTDCGEEAVEQVANGELDAALVFRTVVGDRDDVARIDVPEDINVTIDVSMVVPPSIPIAGAFAAYLDTDEGREIRESFGYLP